MKKFLLDTCIYGEMAIDSDLDRLKENYHHKKDFIVYGFSLIRKELRDTSKQKQYFGKNLRIALLSLYDELVKDKTLLVQEKEVMEIAKKYFRIYRQLGGHYSEGELRIDYLIVACASLKGMDLVVSEDHGTMLSECSRQAYARVNKVLNLREPKFIGYKKFKASLLQGSGGGSYDDE